MPSPLRRRLALASGQVAAQRESLARATAALDLPSELIQDDAAARVAELTAIQCVPGALRSSSGATSALSPDWEK